MNLTLTRRGDYVVRSALCLARAYASGEPRKIREVVAEMAVPATFASQILAELVRAGLVSSRAGKAGGYRLLRSPEEISVLEVVEAGEGPVRADRCTLGDGPCRWDAVCPLHTTWGAATAAFRASLENVSLADIAATDRSIESGTVPVPVDSHRAAPRSIRIDQQVAIAVSAASAAQRIAPLGDRLAALVSRACHEAWASAAPNLEPVPLPAPDQVAVSLRADPPSLQGSLVWEFVPDAGDSDMHFEGTYEIRRTTDHTCMLAVSGRLRPHIPAGPIADAFATALIGFLLDHMAATVAA